MASFTNGGFCRKENQIYMNIEKEFQGSTSFQKAHPDIYKVLIGIFIIILTFTVYRQIVNHDFITFDDGIYVTDNVDVKNGITLRGILWAFSIIEKRVNTYWHPLTWLSHMLDCQLFGLDAGMHHLTNLILHIANAILLFYFLNLATGSIHRSALVAFIFAVHPVNVESVAWIAERKNVLSTFFCMLTMIFYVYYVKRPSIQKYLAALFLYFMGLLAKPMLVTLPFIFILLDYWPLERFDLKQSGLLKKIMNLTAEKIPFFILSACSVYITTVSLKLMTNINSTSSIPIKLRVENAIISYAAYIGKIIWPSKLAVYYPFPSSIPAWKMVVSLVVLIFITLFVLFLFGRLRYLAVGWFWFTGTLVPVSGIIQDGLWPSMADRWAYIPYIGLFIIITWGGYELLNRYRIKKIYTVFASLIILLALSAVTFVQVKYWQDSKSVYKHALEVGPANPVMLNNMGNALVKENKLADAVGYYQEALLLKPDYAKAHNNLASAFYKMGRIDESVRYYAEALRYRPNFYEVHNNFGCVLMEHGKEKEAMFHLREAIRLNPDYDEAHYNLGMLFFRKERMEQAAGHYMRAININPYYAQAHNNLGLVNYKLGKMGKAVKNYNEALKLDPNMAQAHENLGIILFYAGNYDKAIFHLQKAVQINPGNDSVKAKIKSVVEEKDRFQAEEKSLLDKIAGAPDVFANYDYLGDFYLKYKKLDSAAEQYAKAIAIDPKNHILIIKLAKTHAMKGNFNKALSEAEKAIRFKPDYAYGYYFIASVYSLLNDRERAVEWLKKAVDNGFDQWDYMRSDKNLNNIRNTSYYNALSANK